MQTKPAIRSGELWVTFFYGLIEAAYARIQEEQYQEIFGEYMWLVRIAYPVIMGILRIFKTQTKIKGIFRSPVDTKKIHPPATDYVVKKPTVAKERWDEEIKMSNELDEF